MFERVLRVRAQVGPLLVACAGGLALAQGATPPPARACSPGSCFSGSFYLEPGSTVPANAPALLWFPPRDYGGDAGVDAEVQLTRIDGEAAGPVLIEVAAPDLEGLREVRLPKGLVPGARYRLSLDWSGSCPPEPVEFSAGAEAPLPLQLGTIVASVSERGYITVATVSGSCDTTLPAVIADVDVELAADAKPWAPLLQYTLRADAKPWQPSWSLGGPGPYELSGAQTKVFAECAGTTDQNGLPIDRGASHDGLSEGSHQLRYEAALPGRTQLIYSDARELELRCKQPSAEPGDDLSDGGRADAGHGGAHASDAGADHESPPPRTTVRGEQAGDGSDGCAVTAPGGRPAPAASALPWLASALLALALRARLRRRTPD